MTTQGDGAAWLSRHDARRYLVYLGCIVLFAALAPRLSPVWSAILPKISPLGLLSYRIVPLEAERQLGSAFLVAVGCLRKAVSLADEERTRIEAERDAFEQFAEEVKSISAPKLSRTNTLAVKGGNDGERQLEAIRNAYRETVMAVPHFEEEYDETIEESLAAEFDPDVAAAIVDGTQFSPPLKQTILQQTALAIRRREALSSVVEKERASIEEAREHLHTIDAAVDEDCEIAECTFDELIDRYEKLERIENEAERLLEDRQRDVQAENRQHSRSSYPFLQQYLYQPLEVTFPVLDATLEQIRTLRDRRRQVLRTLTRRV